MLTGKEKARIRKAYDLLSEYGLLFYVPGCFDISDAEEAIEYIADPDRFGNERWPNGSDSHN